MDSTAEVTESLPTQEKIRVELLNIPKNISESERARLLAAQNKAISEVDSLLDPVKGVPYSEELRKQAEDRALEEAANFADRDVLEVYLANIANRININSALMTGKDKTMTSPELDRAAYLDFQRLINIEDTRRTAAPTKAV